MESCVAVVKRDALLEICSKPLICNSTIYFVATQVVMIIMKVARRADIDVAKFVGCVCASVRLVIVWWTRSTQCVQQQLWKVAVFHFAPFVTDSVTARMATGSHCCEMR